MAGCGALLNDGAGDGCFFLSVFGYWDLVHGEWRTGLVSLATGFLHAGSDFLGELGLSAVAGKVSQVGASIAA